MGKGKTVTEKSLTVMPHTMTLMDWDKELLVTRKWPELQKAIRELPATASSPNAIADLIHPTAGTLSVGIAGLGDSDNPTLKEPIACANHTPASGDSPYNCIVGDSSVPADTGGIVVFRYENGTWTEIPVRNCVDLATLLDVAKHFCFNGNLDQRFEWEEI